MRAPGRILFAAVICCLPALIASPAAGRAASSVQASTTTGLYLDEGPDLRPLDANTLTDIPLAATTNLGDASLIGSPMAVISRDGTRLAAVSYGANRPSDILIRIIDSRTGTARASFHPAVAMFVEGVSDDGSQLFGTAQGIPRVTRVTWYVLNGSNGHLISATHLSQWCCVPTLYDSAGRRLYVMNMAQQSRFEKLGPRTLTIVSYDTSSGRLVGHLKLNGVLAGSWETKRMVHGYPVSEQEGPGYALSPDRRTIAVLDGRRDLLEIVDAKSLKILRSVELMRPQSLLDRLGEWLGIVPTVAEAKEVEGTNVDIQFSPDGSRLYETGGVTRIGKHGKFSYTSLGVRLINVASGQIVAEALHAQDIWWLLVSPDGRAIYAFGPTNPAPGTTIWRLDPSTLQAVARRSLTSSEQIYGLYLLNQPGRSLGCQPPSPITSDGTEGVAPRASLWALGTVVTANTSTKIIWRMTGVGALRLYAEAEDGTRIAPDWMQQHTGGSTFNKPGDEWGSGFTFPKAGCWRIHAMRDTTAGDVWLQVAPGKQR